MEREPLTPHVVRRAAGISAGGTGARARAWLARELPAVTDTDVAWVDDLGLRRFESPTLVFASASRDVPPPDVAEPSAADVFADACQSSTHLAALLSILIDDCGAWDDAHAVAGACADWIEADPAAARTFVADTEWGALAVVRCGNVLGVLADARCLTCFELVATNAPDDTDRALARFRIAVAHIKRLGSTSSEIADALAAADREAAVIQDVGDRTTTHALIGNLRALTFVRARDLAGATREVHSAWELVDDDDIAAPRLGRQFLDEVRTQVLSNLAVVTGMTSSWAAAVPLFERGVAIAATSSSSTLRMETNCLLGLALYHAGDLDRAHEALHLADAASADTVAVTQRAHVHKLLALLEDDRGNIAARDGWLARLDDIGGATPALAP